MFDCSEQEKLDKVVECFNGCFAEPENTLLKTGAKEPFYLAAKDGNQAIIYSREDFLSSALHEIAHWCIAGIERRNLDDFGYWYKPEGRSQQEQSNFESVEIKPQAIEWALSLACKHNFNLSADNLVKGMQASEAFRQNVEHQLKEYLNNNSLPERAKILFEAFGKIFEYSMEEQYCV
ncbi:MAG: elongation factor P hydroxylase [Gammaproteobacteria bacterium]|nr:elongation factor P hydroxylase [Gammaproteobacteria bacterium]MDH5628911.1 elongation factor P hydroxylase [Gammaproteobacteria bacterium]